MGIEITSLKDVPEDDVLQAQDELVQLVQEQNPTIEARIGVLRGLLLNPAGLLQAKNREEIDRLVQSLSLKAIEADPTLADEETVDNVLSNWGITRKEGAKAAGSVTIVLSSSVTTAIGSGAIFEADGQTFVSDSAFVGKAEAATIQNDTDRLMQLLDDGTYAFVVDVTAEDVGEEANLRRDTPVTLQSPPLNFVKAYATDDFVSGRSTETNQEMLARQQEGISGKASSNRVSMNGMLRANEDFADVLATSIIGFGDPEMLRDQHAIWPMSMGGRVDWYCRSSALPVRQQLTLSASLIEKTSDGFGVWQLSVGRDVYPGFFEVRSILLADDAEAEGTFEILSDTRAIDLTGNIFRPDIVDVEEAVYSRFQASVIRFQDSATLTADLTLGDTQDYSVELIGVPQIGDIHDYVAARDQRHAAADILVKAPMPCFVQVSFTINQQAGEDDEISTDGIKTALASAVNRIGFTGRLPVSTLIDVIHGFLPESASLANMDVLGRIRQPDGEPIWIRSSEALLVPSRPEVMVSPQTVQFFLEPADIAISLAVVGELPI